MKRLIALGLLAIILLAGCESADKYDEREEQRRNCPGKWERVDPFSNQGQCRIDSPGKR